MVREVVKSSGDIITVAGDGTAGYSGDGGPAIDAELNGPRGVAVDPAGDLFIADSNNNVVREVVKSTGDIITVAGNGPAGYSGDGGLATNAELDSPHDVAIDSAGDLFIADQLNNVVREVVKSSGDITTVAGDGTAGYSGDGGLATKAELNNPVGLAFDAAGDLFIADWLNNVVREVVKATGDITTVAGDGTAGYSGDGGLATKAELNEPGGIAFDSEGDLFIADESNNVVREVLAATGDIITVAGDGTAGYSGDGGPAAKAELDVPRRVAVDSAGDVFVTDSGNNVVREFTPALTIIVSQAPQVAIISAPLTLIAGVHGGPITVELEDANGNPTTSTVAQTIQLSTTSSAGAFYDSSGDAITSVTITAGQSSATFDYGDTQAGNPTITASDSAFGSPSSQPETIDPAAANHLVVTTTFANPDVAGTPGTVTVTAEDQYDNVAGNGPDQYKGTVDLSSTDSQISGLPPTYTFVALDAGSHIFTGVALETKGNQTITATDSVTSSITGTSPVIDVSPARASGLVIVNRPPSGVAGSKLSTVTVHANDPYGNLDTSFDGQVTIGLASGSAGTLTGTLTQTASAGVATFNDLVDTTSGSITLTAASGTLTTGATGGATLPIDPASTNHFTVTVSFASPDVAGTAGSVTVAAYDTYGNLESSGPNQYLGTVDLSSTDSQISGLPANYPFTVGDAGSHTFNNVALKTAGNRTITATDSATSTITGTSATVNVVPAPASQMAITSAPLTLAAGSRGSITVQLEDPYDNLGATSSADQAIGLSTTSSAGAFYAGPSGGNAITSVTIPAGQSSATFDYADTRAGTPTVTATDAALGSAPTQQETIDPAAASQAAIASAPLTLVAGSRGQVAVRLEDKYGNLGATSTSDQAIGLGTTSSAGAFYAGPSGGNAITSITIPAGQSSATFDYADTQAGNPTVTVADTALSSSVNQAEAVNPAAADHFVLTTSFAGTDVAGTAATVTVTAKDHYGNTAGSGPDEYLGTANLGSSDGQATGLPASHLFTATDAGLYTFTGVVLKTAGDQTIKATDSATSTITGTSAAVNVVPAPASQMAITSPR